MPQPDRTKKSRRPDRTKLALLRLESRIVPTTNLVLDFDGLRRVFDPVFQVSYPVFLRGDQGFTLPVGAEHVDWFGAGISTQGIRQIVAGVRQDFADFDVNVIWDDRGFETLDENNAIVISQPRIANKDTVIMITSNPNDSFEGPTVADLGFSAFDTRQLRADLGFVFGGSIFGSQPNPDSSELINQYISAISQQAARTFGLSPAAVTNSDHRQISFPTVENNGHDTRFSNLPVGHLAPEAGKVYAERDRLFANLGAAKFGSTLAPNEVLTNQTLFLDAPVLALNTQNFGAFTDSVPTANGAQPLRLEFAGDRDAFRIVLAKNVTYNIRERAVTTAVSPVLTLWDRNGNLVASGEFNSDQGFISFTPSVAGSYYLVAGSTYDLSSGNGANGGPGSIGSYHLEIAPTWLDVDTVSGIVTIFGDATNNIFSVARTNGVLTANIIVPATKTAPAFVANSYALSAGQRLIIAGGAGNDTYNFDLAAGAFDVSLVDSSGSDSIAVNGTDNPETVNIDALGLRASAASIAFADFEALALSTFGGIDTINIAGGPLTMSIDGGDPGFPLIPDDALNVTIPDAVQNTTANSFVTPSGQTVFYTGFSPVVGTTIGGDDTDNTILIGLIGGVLTVTVTSQALATAEYTLVGGEKLILSGGKGNDSYIIDLASGALELSIVDASGSDTLTVAGTDAAETVNVFGSGLRTATASIVFSDIESLALTTGDGDDIVNIAGGPDAITVDGGNSVVAGDILNVTIPGAVRNGANTQYTVTVGGFVVSTIDYSGFEFTAVTINGDGNANTFTIALVNGVPTAFVDAANKQTTALKSGQKIILSGFGGDDTYSFDLAAGGFEVIVADSSGNDSITVAGTATEDAVALDNLGLHTATASIAFSGIEALSLATLGGVDTVTVSGGPLSTTIDGGDPSAGDTLNVKIPGAVRNAAKNRYETLGSPTLSYTGFESFDVPPPVPVVITEERAFAVGAGTGAAPQVSLYLTGRDTPTYTIMAYDPSFRGGVRVATGDIDGDGIPDLITGAGPGGGSHVRVFSGTNPDLIITEFFAYPGFTGGLFVAAGDVDGDGRTDIVTGADAGGGPHVKAFSGVDGREIFSVFAYFGGFRGGVRVAAGDIDGDGRDEIITGAGSGGGPHVRVLDGRTADLITEYYAFGSTFTGGIYVAAGDINGDRRDDIVAGAGEGGGPVIVIRDGTTRELIGTFLAYPTGTTASTTWSSGARVAVADSDADGHPEIFTVPGRGRSAVFKAFSQDGTQVWSRAAGDPTFLGGAYVG